MSDTKIKLCGMRRPQDIEAVNALLPEYIGFIFWPKSHRNVSPEEAAGMKALLDSRIQAVGVFVDSPVEAVAHLLNAGIIDLAQLHGHEDAMYISALRALCPGKEIIKAYKIKSAQDLAEAQSCPADHILLDSGTGSGEAFDWSLVKGMNRPFFLAGGLHPENVQAAIQQVSPWAVDVSSGIETDKFKDYEKMRAFVENVRSLS